MDSHTSMYIATPRDSRPKINFASGSLIASEAGASGTLPSTVKKARWAFSVQPLLGWGKKGEKQRATAGWLASLPVFEPHWQVVFHEVWAKFIHPVIAS